MKPRWKTLIELGVALVFVFVGSNMMARGVNGALDEPWDIGWLVLGLAVVWIGLDQLHDRWVEL